MPADKWSQTTWQFWPSPSASLMFCGNCGAVISQHGPHVLVVPVNFGNFQNWNIDIIQTVLEFVHMRPGPTLCTLNSFLFSLILPKLHFYFSFLVAKSSRKASSLYFFKNLWTKKRVLCPSAPAVPKACKEYLIVPKIYIVSTTSSGSFSIASSSDWSHSLAKTWEASFGNIYFEISFGTDGIMDFFPSFL